MRFIREGGMEVWGEGDHLSVARTVTTTRMTSAAKPVGSDESYFNVS